MKISALATLLAILSIPSSTTARQAPDWERLLGPCQAAAAAAFGPALDRGYLERHIARARMDEGDALVQRMLCTAYFQGALDMADGRIVPLDLD